jgi:antitoxin PrlF
MLQATQGVDLMRAIQATITERGQVTLPAAVRRQLGVEPGGKILFQIEDNGTVSVAVAPFTFQTVRASVSPLDHPMSDETLAEVLEDARTARYRRSRASAKP